ncbi:2,3-butanediol dehydrogenase [Caballeronia ptereochthonis]|uniref:Alcohol dehydrogenase n=1 Tax=Caballeronia ptereochthonis TaxID=1777144 RepID=A0A158C3J6_9BURK|nr:2,3-butanediol dehydrogenase [Caballeronia ptereochthonis]SAK76902.1 alcohol dehydrogenase [Caballeronia ptereochthonis]
MKAAVYYGNRQLTIDDVPEPWPVTGEVKVKVSRNGICGTDIHEYFDGPVLIPKTEPHPLTGKTLPVVIGHEFSGTVVEVGPDVTDIKEGDKVAIEPVIRCGMCRPCKSGYYNVCNCVGFQGLSSDGGMAEYAVVPRHMVHKLPDNVPVEMGALVEPMAVAYHAATLGEVTDQSRTLIFGAGPIGIGLWFALRGMGVTEIDVVEPSPTRRQAIEGLGARTIDPTSTDVPAFIADKTNGEGVDAAYDAAGVPAAVAAGLKSLGEHRTLVSVAIYDKPMLTPLLDTVMRERRIQGTLCYTSKDYKSVIDLMERGHYKTTGWVETVPLANVVAEGFEELRAGRKMKVLIDPAQ